MRCHVRGAASRCRHARALIGEEEPIEAYLPRRHALFPSTTRVLADSIVRICIADLPAGWRLFFILAQDIADPLFQAVEVPLPLIADNGAQQRVDLADGVHQIA
jgi:hypothetical protein